MSETKGAHGADLTPLEVVWIDEVVLIEGIAVLSNGVAWVVCRSGLLQEAGPLGTRRSVARRPNLNAALASGNMCRSWLAARRARARAPAAQWPVGASPSEMDSGAAPRDRRRDRACPSFARMF